MANQSKYIGLCDTCVVDVGVRGSSEKRERAGGERDSEALAEKIGCGNLWGMQFFFVKIVCSKEGALP